MAWDNIISRSVWLILQPSNFLILSLLIGFVVTRIAHEKSRARRTAVKIVAFSIFFLAVSGLTNLSSWLLWPLEKRFETFTNNTEIGPYSGIIVLAGSERTSISTASNQATFNNASERLTETAKLARLYPDLPIIHSGGGRKDESEWSENDVARHFFQDANIDLARIRFEGRSYNTHSNAIESAKLINPSENNNWLLVTSAFHMPRSVGAFQEAGINIQPYPAGYLTTLTYQGIFNFDVSANLARLDWAIHEYIGLLAYYFTGRSSNLFPNI